MYAWHRMFGIGMTKLFAGTAWEVVLELDLSIKQQMLDVIVVRRQAGPEPALLPDGFRPLADHNLLTYKSHHEALDGWAIKELVGHAVNYRKQVSPSFDRLLPESAFRMIAISTRFPEKLAKQVTLQSVSPGVYDVAWGTDVIRLLVLRELPTVETNCILNLFSGRPPQIIYGREHSQDRLADASVVLNLLFEHFLDEGLAMTFTVEQQNQWMQDELVRLRTKRLKAMGISPDELLKAICPEDLLKSVSPETLLAALPAEARQILEQQLQKKQTESKRKPQGRSKSAAAPRRERKR